MVFEKSSPHSIWEAILCMCPYDWLPPGVSPKSPNQFIVPEQKEFPTSMLVIDDLDHNWHRSKQTHILSWVDSLSWVFWGAASGMGQGGMHLLLCKKVNVAGLTAILKKTCLQGRPLAGVWEHGCWEGSHHSLTDKTGSLCLNCTNNMIYAEHLISLTVCNFGPYCLPN